MGQVEQNIIELLLAYGADVNIENLNSETSIFSLFYLTNNRPMKSKLNLFKILLDAGANVNKQDTLGYTLLQYLVIMTGIHYTFEQMIIVVRYLLDVGANETLNIQNYSGQTVLHLACQCPEEDSHLTQLAYLLLFHGTNPNISDNQGQTALHYAAMDYRNICLIKVLKHYGADMNAHNHVSHTPLHKFCTETKFNNNNRVISFLELLVQLGCNINSCSIDNPTVLHLAFEKRNASICRTLLINSQGYLQRTPLHFAARNLRSDQFNMVLILMLKTGTSRSNG
ncbi:unnamed protein product [Didymodactylos carnosus]|uniref:Uncharacterized protein n=1 Tax=Didymodactylos carnosus TaxID=1234261 RepID=A0A814YQE6_9BILA|nr:unnamed protein product [Didymodactylos carnosus]CAF1493881.1 unnamed protein product [Didymodactylos carnosus]CAF3995802.1 unnamed protein product [Didymodactylos carnosus]CAF4283037.1 unnamed protein product [Didymodactylos carnosus]